MKAKTLQIIWHEKQPVFSVDFHPDGYLATGGADREIKVNHIRGCGGHLGAQGKTQRTALIWCGAACEFKSPHELGRPPRARSCSAVDARCLYGP